MTDTQQENLQEYIELLRSNVRDQKDEVLGFIMALDVDQSAKFRPIYSEYDAELTQYNGRVKDSLGTIEAARFLQIEDQLLAIIDLQSASVLPLVGREQ